MPSSVELEDLWDELNLIIPPIKQCISGLRGVYQLGLVSTLSVLLNIQQLAPKGAYLLTSLLPLPPH